MLHTTSAMSGTSTGIAEVARPVSGASSGISWSFPIFPTVPGVSGSGYGAWGFNLQVFEVKDNMAREAILSGVSAFDAAMICQEETAQAMWNSFVDKQTKREYSNYIFARAELYSNVLTLDKTMNQRLQTPLGYGARTHCGVVRQFSKHYVVGRDGRADRPVPMATQVMNALRAESALDEKINIEEQTSVDVAACGKRSTQLNHQKPPGKGKRKRSGREGKESSKQGNKPGKKAGGGTNQDKQNTRTCYHCGKVGERWVDIKVWSS
ncbi:uncharacterized protein PITG_12273 [Phytophthora infestans T30-4]|uniref:Uncharacterized protein n=1 Tax=Phytophthora infestans (strain T30-4) TaxID=403677 RepID=D0NJG6_PHYIT|nr:uncharacterized protein PITG_12273 [Phytophthora infestans T30-4]EEY59684.1 conserved hypothetical protein [Phytophthora infestans T30-4]|eukprot:XP_002900877.1 conserved hypothetical protein [Phytophthora infestans T30-4]